MTTKATKATKTTKTTKATKATKATHSFQTEVKALLRLMVHSLYSNKEIFLRELISNAADAADKLRFDALSDDSLFEGEPDLWAHISSDQKANTLTIADNGIGMHTEDVVTHLGTIAKSGTAEFLHKLSGNQRKDSQLIGQFGVGFYSAFMVANKVQVHSRRAGAKAQEGVLWTSTGDGSFTTEPATVKQRGTSITLHLKDDCKEFADPFRLRSIITRFSDHIQLAVQMPLDAKDQHSKAGQDSQDGQTNKDSQGGQDPEADEVKGDKGDKATSVLPGNWQTINKARALWTRPKSEIHDEEYQEFYQQLAHDNELPLGWTHNRVEGKLEYTSLLYLPRKAPFDLWNRDFPRGVKLYVQRVFIMDKAEELLPLYLRFVKGVVDSNDLSLNVSREILQSDKRLETMRAALTKRVLGMLATMATQKPQDYQLLWNEFGRLIKEGVAEDFANRDALLKLLRFTSSTSKDATEDVSLDDYLARMIDKQDKIYYLVGENWDIASNNPHLEGCKRAGIEVLLLTDRIDEWFMAYVHEYQGKGFADLSREEIDFDKLANLSEDEKKSRKHNEDELADLPRRLGEVYGDRVKEVRLGRQLVDSPACIMQDKGDIGLQMRRIMQTAGQQVPESKPILEINPNHSLIRSLKSETNNSRFDNLAFIILDQALLSEGELPAEPTAYVQRVNSLLTQLMLQG